MPLPRFRLLDVVRGGAILAVCIYHASWAYRTGENSVPSLAGIFLPVAGLGWFGVDVFFVLSGYGIAAKLAADPTMQGAKGVARFASNRAWRILPTFWFCGLLMLAATVVASRFNHLDWHTSLPAGWLEWLAAGFLLTPITGTPPLLPIVTWTLTSEAAFYALTAAGIAWRERVSTQILLTLATALTLTSLLNVPEHWAWFFNFWPEFVCGLLLYAALQAQENSRRAGHAFALLGIVVIAMMAWWDGMPRVTMAAVGALSLGWLWRFDGTLSSYASARGLAWLGGISYPLFLMHIPVISRLQNLAGRVVPSDSFFYLLALMASVGASIALAWAIQRLIERPLRTFTRPRATLTPI